MNTSIFWDKLDELVTNKRIVIDRPKGTTHPRYADYIYPYDYGFLEGTTAADGSGIDVWVGSGEKKVTAIVIVYDPVKSDMENKLLVGCDIDEMNTILTCHQRGDMIAYLVSR